MLRLANYVEVDCHRVEGVFSTKRGIWMEC